MIVSKLKYLETRAGGTLVEMLVVIVLTAVLLASGVSMIASLMAYRSGSNRRALEISEQNRLTDILRSDLRHSKTVSFESDSVLSIIGQRNESVRYSLDESACQREFTTVEGSERRIERYQVGGFAAWEIAETSGKDISLLEVVVKPDSNESLDAASPALRVVAARQDNQ